MSTEQLTDEQIGRRWCEKNGKRPEVAGRDPDEPHHPKFRWWTDDTAGFDKAFGLPELLWMAVDGYSTEVAAYAVVGAALRQLWEFAESSRKDVLS